MTPSTAIMADHVFAPYASPNRSGCARCYLREDEHPGPAPCRDAEVERAFLDDAIEFAEKLGSVRWDGYRVAVRHRLTIGAERYGDSAFFTRDNVKELLEETPDIAAYCLLELQKVLQEFGEDSEEYLQRRHHLLACAAYGALCDHEARQYARVVAGLD